MLKVAFVMNLRPVSEVLWLLKAAIVCPMRFFERHRGHAMDRSKLFLESLRSTRARLNEEVLLNGRRAHGWRLV